VKIVVNSGSARKCFDVLPSRDARRDVARTLKSFLFPSNGSFHKAKRRGERALAMSA
jgi:hypothetical protein